MLLHLAVYFFSTRGKTCKKKKILWQKIRCSISFRWNIAQNLELKNLEDLYRKWLFMFFENFRHYHLDRNNASIRKNNYFVFPLKINKYIKIIFK